MHSLHFCCSEKRRLDSLIFAPGARLLAGSDHLERKSTTIPFFKSNNVYENNQTKRQNPSNEDSAFCTPF
jgi:hypothetical protein